MPGKYLAFIAYSVHFQLPLFPLLFNSILHMIFLSYFANDPAWISNCQTIRWDIFCYNTPCTNYTSFSYGNTTANNHINQNKQVPANTEAPLLLAVILAISVLALLADLHLSNYIFLPIYVYSGVIAPIPYPLDHTTPHLEFFLFQSFPIPQNL